jgi:hypothetical protein
MIVSQPARTLVRVVEVFLAGQDESPRARVVDVPADGLGDG